MHLDMYLSAGGPSVPDIHLDEMNEQDLRNVMAYMHAALTRGLEHGLDEAMLGVLTEWYDEVFCALVATSERFRENMLKGFVFPPGGVAARKKYVDLAKEASES